MRRVATKYKCILHLCAMAFLLVGPHSLATASEPEHAGCDIRGNPAVGRSLGHIKVRRAVIEIFAVGDAIVSEPGESRDAFALRIAPVFRAFTAATGREACAAICEGTGAASGQWGVVPTTSMSEAHCVTTTACPAGFKVIDESIHSHPIASRFTVCAVDQALMGKSVKVGSRIGLPNVQGFSPQDFSGGAGYLVTKDTVLHQRGKSSVRSVGDVLASN